MGLIDLEELCQRCRDTRVRSLIKEAVQCYQVAAYRACVLMTWESVIFDYVYKLEELGSVGDLEAAKEATDFFKWFEENDIPRLQKFESGCLDNARKRYKLLSAGEFEELSRLQSDRHKCAHPSLNSLLEPYHPTPELARYHLRNAVENMCMKEPTMGKAAIDQIWSEIESPVFPRNAEAAVKRLETTPLLRLRDTALRELVLGLMTTPLKEDKTVTELSCIHAALHAIRLMKPEFVEGCFKDKLLEKFRSLTPAQITKAFQFLREFPFASEYLDSDMRAKLKATISVLDLNKQLEVFWFAAYTDDFFDDVRSRAAGLSNEQLADFLAFEPISIWKRLVIDRLEAVRSFNQGRSVFDKLVMPVVEVNAFTTVEVGELLSVCCANAQLRQANLYMPSRFGRLLDLAYCEDLKGICTELYEKIVRSESRTVLDENWKPLLEKMEKLLELERSYSDLINDFEESTGDI